MKYLLDSHVWLWLVSEPEKLREETLLELGRSDSELYLSVASAWELGIKFSLGKLDLPEPPEQFIPSRLTRDRIHSLPVELSHALKAAALPNHHKDPFDRLLIAQSQLSGLRLVTRDAWIGQYDVEWLEA